mmetsp:Transcript_35564/g.26428  ORF Transcript_35564/g.26428 Transcript_35564/m.26428 type:complete len:91 (+) Transcript_35564:464-736(+)
MKLKERYTHRMSDYIHSWKDWLHEPCFYIYGMVFMFVRAGLQYILAIQPFYIIFVLGYYPTEDNPTPPQIAAVNLVSTFASIICAVFFQR